MLSKSLDFLRKFFLIDWESDTRTKIYHVEGSEKGFDHLRIYTQNSEQKRHGVAMLHKVYTEEVETPKPTE